MMKYQAVIFDFDYTLGDSTEGIIESANYGLEALGYAPAPREDVRKTIGLSLVETYHALTGDASKDHAQIFDRSFKEKADQVMVKNTSLYPGVIQMLEELKGKGLLLGIVTTKFHYRIDAILEKCRAEGYFDVIVGGEDVASMKPDPEGVFLALAAWKLEAGRVLYVGDSVVDAKTAKASGVDFAGVTTGTTSRGLLGQYPNVGIFQDLEEIRNFINS